MYINLDGKATMSDGEDPSIWDSLYGYAEGVVTDATAITKQAALDKVAELFGQGKSNEQPPAGSGTTVVAPPPIPATQTGAGTVPAEVPAPAPAPATSTVMSTVKQFPGWGIGLTAGIITYLLSESIIGGLAVAGGGWFLFDKATK